MKVATRNNLLKKLANFRWGTYARIIRTTALALCYSTAEYAAPVWERSAHAHVLNPELNQACRAITGCLKPTNVENLYLLAGIAPPEIRRSVCARVERTKQVERETHSLFGHTPARSRLKSRRSFLDIDLTAAFDTVSHDILLSKIAGSSLPPAITRWLSCYMRGRQAATSFRGTKSSTRIVRTGVPQESKLSPSLFNYYIADMLRPTPPVKRVCYADDITVWASGPKIPQLESMINKYLRDVSIYLKDNSLLISAPKSTVTLFTPDKHQFQTHPNITLEDTQLPLECSPKILGVIMDTSLSFHKHCNYVSERIDKRNNMLKALAGSSWGQEKETLLMTYNALGKSIASYATPVWSTNASDSSFKKIQTAQNAALRTVTGAHKMASIDHLHQESLTLKVKDHSDMLSAQYLVNCLEEDHVCHGITTQKPRP